MVDEQSDERVKVDLQLRLSVVSVRAETNFVHHVLNLLVGRVVAHSSHQIRQLVDWDLALKLASFGRVFFLRTNHRVVEEVVDVLVGLALGTTFN